MIYFTPLIFMILWACGGNLNHNIRRFGIPFVMCLFAWHLLGWFTPLLFLSVWGAITAPYGDEPTDLPRWACGALYGASLLILALFSGHWVAFFANLAISTFMTWWFNDVSPIKDKSIKGWSIAEALTGLFAYLLFPFLL